MAHIINEREIVSQWGPKLEEVTGITNSNKLLWMSKLCHFQELVESENSSLNESFSYSAYSSLAGLPNMGIPSFPSNTGTQNSFYTATPGSGDKFQSLLPISIQVAARTVGFDIVGVIPMSMPQGMLAYLDYVYAGGTVSGTTKPFIVKVDAPDINSTKYTTGTTYWAVSDLAAGAANFANTVKAVEMKFVGYTRVIGLPMFQIGSTYVMSGTTNTFGTDTAANAAVTLAQIFDGGAYIVPDSSSKPSLTNTSTAYASVTAVPTLVEALENSIQGFAGAGDSDTDNWYGPYADDTQTTDSMSRATGETTYYRSMGLQVRTKLVYTKTAQVDALVTTEQLQDLNKQHSLDVLGLIETALVNELTQHINKHILSRVFALGWSNNYEYYLTDGITLNCSLDPADAIGGTATYKNKIGANQSIIYNAFQDFGDFENMAFIQRRIKSKIEAASNIILQRNRRGRATFVVTNLQLATALQDNAQFTFLPMAGDISQESGSLYPLGTIAGMTVYVDPNMSYNDNRVLVGRKGADNEPGVKFCPYLMAEKIQTISEGTMGPKIALKSRYALIDAGHYPETYYYTFYVHLNGMII